MLDFWCTNSDYCTFSPEFNHPVNVYNHFPSPQNFVMATSAKMISQLPPSARDLSLTRGTQTDRVNLTLRGHIMFHTAENHKQFFLQTNKMLDFFKEIGCVEDLGVKENI